MKALHVSSHIVVFMSNSAWKFDNLPLYTNLSINKIGL